MNISFIALFLTQSSLSHASLMAASSRMQLHDFSIKNCVFLRQLSPIFFQEKGSYSLNVRNSEFGFFIGSAIHIDSAFSGWYSVNRTVACNVDNSHCNPTITCPKAVLSESWFHDFSSDRLNGAAFAAAHSTEVVITGCFFYRIKTTTKNGQGACSADVGKPITMKTTCFSECDNVENRHAFYFQTTSSLTVEQSSVFLCGKDKQSEVAIVGATTGLVVKTFNSSHNTNYETVGTGLVFDHIIKNFKVEYCHFQDLSGASVLQFMTSKPNTYEVAIENCNFIHVLTDGYAIIKFNHVSDSGKIYQTSLKSCVFHSDNTDNMIIYWGSGSDFKINSVIGCISNSAFNTPKNIIAVTDKNWKVIANPTPLSIPDLLVTGASCHYGKLSNEDGEDTGGEDGGDTGGEDGGDTGGEDGGDTGGEDGGDTGGNSDVISPGEEDSGDSGNNGDGNSKDGQGKGLKPGAVAGIVVAVLVVVAVAAAGVVYYFIKVRPNNEGNGQKSKLNEDFKPENL